MQYQWFLKCSLGIPGSPRDSFTGSSLITSQEHCWPSHRLRDVTGQAVNILDWCATGSLSQLLNSATVEKQAHTFRIQWVWLCPNKAYFTETGRRATCPTGPNFHPWCKTQLWIRHEQMFVTTVTQLYTKKWNLHLITFKLMQQVEGVRTQWLQPALRSGPQSEEESKCFTQTNKRKSESTAIRNRLNTGPSNTNKPWGHLYVKAEHITNVIRRILRHWGNA